MILKLLNWQGIAGMAVTFTLLVMLTVQKLEAVHWKKQSDQFEHLYQQEQAAFATTVANARAAAAQAEAADKANAERVAADSAPSTKGPPMISKAALLLLVLSLSACASSPKPQAIPVLAQAHQCPAYPLPPEELLRAPAKTDFLPQTPSSRLNRPSSLTN